MGFHSFLRHSYDEDCLHAYQQQHFLPPFFPSSTMLKITTCCGSPKYAGKPNADMSGFTAPSTGSLGEFYFLQELKPDVSNSSLIRLHDNVSCEFPAPVVIFQLARKMRLRRISHIRGNHVAPFASFVSPGANSRLIMSLHWHCMYSRK